jgi:hypothetical protein
MNRTALLACCALSLLALTLPARNAGSQAAPQPKKPETPPASRAAAPPAGGPKSPNAPAETVFKNIKVLTGMPASQMFPVMHLMRASLGVRCDFCHVAENGKFDLDTKEEKQTARQMVKMVLEINKNNFEGKTVVTCNSCHHGQTRPVAVPPTTQGQFADTTHGEPEAAGREALPKAAQVLDHYIEALGGKAALAAVTSRVSRGTMLRGKVLDSGTPKARMVNRGEEVPLEIVQQAPARLKATIGAAADRVVQTFDGSAGTVETPDGKQRPLNPQELRRLAAEADLHKELELREQAEKMRVGGKDEVDGRAVYVVRGATKDGRRESLYFDVESGLLVRQIVLNPTIIGADPEQTDYSDYRTVDGVKVPFVVKATYLDDNHLGTTRKLTEIRDNPPGKP